ncbi:MAG: ATP-binding cassette domain-containing protein [Roseimicrobium sp.]
MPSAPFHSAPALTLSGGTGLTKELVLGVPFAIGASRSADFRIPHPTVARRHVTLQWDGQQTVMTDESGGLGVTLNGAPATSGSLRDGDVLRVGHFEFLYHAPKATHPAPVTSLTVLFRGNQVEEFPLQAGMALGCGEQADVRLHDPTLLPVHAWIQQTGNGFEVVDAGGAGLLANGKFFERHALLIGDRLDVGEHHAFAFDGWGLRRIPRESGCSVTAQNLEVVARGRTILSNAGFAAKAGDFVGIIGPSGAGKSTLLRALVGMRTPQAGTVSLNHAMVESLPDAQRCFGFVPQDEIVHLELTARQALRYTAALRMPARTPKNEIEKLINRIAAQLGLTERLDTPSRNLSGGQLKRLSVAVELLSLPQVLLLDEPTSGLDPEAERQLMRQLRELTATGCTVICTTHLMENLHLMDSVEVIAASPERSEAGTTVFRGKPSAMRAHFETEDFTGIYQRLREHAPSQWRALFEQRTGQSASTPQAPAEPATPPTRPKLKRRAATPILLQRQRDLLCSDLKNVWLLLGQPLLIGLLLALAAAGEKDQSATKIFLACIASFWMACGNAAPEFVRERAIFERERFAGLGIGAYLSAKFLWLWGVSLAQGLLLLGVLKLVGGLSGDGAWQCLALGGVSLAATGIGLFISAWSRTVLQAVLLVPVVTIPQILFSGYVFEAKDWNDRPAPRILSRAFPGFAAQRIADTSLLWHKRILHYDDMDKAGLVTSYENLCTALVPTVAWLNAESKATVTLDGAALYASTGGRPPRVREIAWDPKARPTLQLGAHYAWPGPALGGLATLLCWAFAGLCGAFMLLRAKRD